MSLPTLIEIGATLGLLALCIYMATLFSNLLKLRPERPSIDNAKRESVLALILVVAIFILTTVLEAFRFMVFRPMFRLDTRSPSIVDQYNVLFTCIFYTPWLVLLFVAIRKTQQKPDSFGIQKKNNAQALEYGFGLGFMYFVIVGLFSSALSGGFPGFSTSLVWGLLDNAIIGLSEETAWRGYIQTRLAAFGGPAKGLVATSLLFGFLHFPQRYFLYSGAVVDALASALLVCAAGLLFGYVMLRSQNILSSSIMHLTGNWSALFWGISSF